MLSLLKIFFCLEGLTPVKILVKLDVFCLASKINEKFILLN